MRLSRLAASVPGAQLAGGDDPEIEAVTQDSGQARPGVLFVAVRGHRSDGHAFAQAAAAAGAAVAIERAVGLPAGTPALRVADGRSALAELAAELAGRPARSLLVAGVTGTDGKTTTTHMAAHLLSSAGLKAAALSTVAFSLGQESGHNASGLTTPDPVEIQARLAEAVAAGARAAVIEVSSHALDQRRVVGCEFDVAAFTNVGHDHLDYHGTWEAYLAAKASLVDLCRMGTDKGIVKTAVLNRDDKSYQELARRDIQRRWSYSLRRAAAADLRAEAVDCGPAGCHFELRRGSERAEVALSMPARFNVNNALCAAGIALALGIDLDLVARGLSSFPGVPGRLERVDLGQPFPVFIDFAHAAGSLGQALAELRPMARGRVLAVFGSTARSDHDRPGMGRAAARGADHFIITTDDPLGEDPEEIALQVAAGAAGAEDHYTIVLNRSQAIRQVMAMAKSGDVVLLAGKGHERTMMTASGNLPWDERGEAEAALRELGFGTAT